MMLGVAKTQHRAGAYLAVILTALLLWQGTAFGQEARQADFLAVSAVLEALEGPMATEMPVVYRKEGGYIHFLGAPPAARFNAGAPLDKSSDPEMVARHFMDAYAGAFGSDHLEMELRTRAVVLQSGKHFVRLDQYFGDLPVLGAQVVVQVNDDMQIYNVMSDIMRDTSAMDSGRVALTPVIQPDAAGPLARRLNAALMKPEHADTFEVTGAPALMLFHPGVFDLFGDTRLVWKVLLTAQEPYERGMVVFVDAHRGELVFRYADLAGARYREVYDADFSFNLDAARLAREEGDAPSGNAEVDKLYDYLGDCYDFYWERHGRDSIDNLGMKLIGYANIPFQNAAYVLNRKIMLFGPGFVADDVVGHEYTHGVTSEVIDDLLYFGFSGAIAEMYSDQGGEFIDLTNGRGNDTPAVRWFIGEDLGIKLPDQRGREDNVDISDTALPGIRYMKDPTVFGDPDRLGSPFLKDPASMEDLGGLHSNSGIGNKLVYLLTDGDIFNGQTVHGMGLEVVGDLFYEARPLLGRAPTYCDLYFALGAASVDIGLSVEERINIANGIRAVEIDPPEIGLLGLRYFRATPTTDYDNNPVIGLTWSNPDERVYTQISLYRSAREYPTGPLNGLRLPIRKGDTKYLDRNVIEGTEYFYTLIADISAGLPQVVHAKATAGGAAPDIQTEVFGLDPVIGLQGNYDLQYAQLTFRPVGAPPASLGTPLNDMGYDAYEATIRRQVYQLPIRRNDEYGGAYTITFNEYGIVPMPMGDRVFPYFGQKYNRVIISAHGYVAFEDCLRFHPDALQALNFPSIAAHFAIPRISFMFTQFDHAMGGDVWMRILPDRLVVTFENVPLKSLPPMINPLRSTAQMELFDSGHIRITYLESNMFQGVIGLSDGRGAPRDPMLEFDDLRQAYSLTDFISIPTVPRALSIDPVTPPRVKAGEAAAFTAVALLPPELVGTPAYFAEWDGPGPAPFTDRGDGFGSFYWPTQYRDKGIHTVRVKATLGDARAYQDVRVIVNEGFEKPFATNLRLSTDSAYEDPAQDRSISPGRPLIGSYRYDHPYRGQFPHRYAEGPSLIYWFRNGQLAPAFTGVLLVPATVPQPGDRWWFTVTPVTMSYISGEPAIWGEPAASPIVTVVGAPIIESVSPAQALTIGGERITIRGRFLSSPLAARFGGVPGMDIRMISDTEISLISPAHPVGVVDVSVETPFGVGMKSGAFTFVADPDDDPPEEEPEKKSQFGCGSGNRDGGFSPADLLVVLFAAVVLLRAGRMSGIRHKYR